MKLSNRCVVYSIEGGNPLFFDPDGRGGLLPTVYALSALPRLLPRLETWSEVSGKVLGGESLPVHQCDSTGRLPACGSV